METEENSSGALRPGEHGWGSHRLQSPGSVRRPLVESECTGNCNRSNCGFLLDVNADANMVCVPVDDDMEGENVQLRRGVRERKRTSKGEAQIAKKTRVAVAAEQDKEGSAAVGKSDRKRASKEEAQNEVAKKKTAKGEARSAKKNSRGGTTTSSATPRRVATLAFIGRPLFFGSPSLLATVLPVRNLAQLLRQRCPRPMRSDHSAPRSSACRTYACSMTIWRIMTPLLPAGDLQ